MLTVASGARAQVVRTPLGESEYARVARVKNRQQDGLFALDSGVVGVGIGLSDLGRLTLDVMVADDVVAGRLPQEIEGLPVRVIVTGPIVAIAGCGNVPEKPRFCDRPVPIGVSTGHFGGTVGTIGCRVTDGTNVYALSNNHVYAALNNANIGDNILQPSSGTIRMENHGGVNPDDAIGTLFDFEPLVFCVAPPGGGACQCRNNSIDAAIALVNCTLDTATPPDGYGVPNAAIHPAFGNPNVIGDAGENLPSLIASAGVENVQKYGAATQLTRGRVVSVNLTVAVGYGGVGCQTVAEFGDVIAITEADGLGRITDAGDSGSLVVTNDANKHPVGLIFGESTNMTITFAIAIDLVLTRFGVTVDDRVGVFPCEDGLFCNGVEMCDGGTCLPGVDPCPGQMCDEQADACVDCLTDGDCTDNMFCNGAEVCVAGTCQAGTPPDCSSFADVCNNGACNETLDTCEAAPKANGTSCDDGVFCNGIERCSGGVCTPGAQPCPFSLCDEANARCVTCLVDGDCDDTLFCTGVEMCVDGQCPAGTPPCAVDQFCIEQTDTCVDCLDDLDCADEFFCNGAETCVAGACMNGSFPCSEPQPICVEATDSCVACIIDDDCDDSVFCNGAETCVAGTCQMGPEPCLAEEICDEANDECVDCFIDDDCDDDLFCNGEETCDNGTCIDGTDPCGGGPCNEDQDSCTPCVFEDDCDGDGVCDDGDNCVDQPNADQRDTDGDGFGNACDPDKDGNSIVDAADLAIMIAAFSSSSIDDEDCDLDGDGVVGMADVKRLLEFFGNPPGPSNSGVCPP